MGLSPPANSARTSKTLLENKEYILKTATLLIGNWKMNLAPSEASSYAKNLVQALPRLEHTAVWVAPTDISIPAVIDALSGTPLQVGGQNSHWKTSGAFTGETSPVALRDCGATFSIIGHSERRVLFGETSTLVSQRTVQALECGLTPVVCIGESEQQRQDGRTEEVLMEQLQPVLSQLTAESFPRVVFAYEPVWAIGTGKVATPAEVQDTHTFIRNYCREAGFSDAEASVIYGGSVNPTNARDILSLPAVSGALVGGASINLKQWVELIRISESLG